ncbi:MAG: peptide chain release factor N(5)-glutamine methyltransferase [Vicinamibacterales bacterium]|nr:peptide chain release factor N(5)-glutamine methyltransferase [Vicinamibacterales bacterium]
MPTLADYIRDARRRLEEAGIAADEAAVDADVLARHALGGWERGQLIARMRDDAPATFPGTFGSLVERRARREPAAYIMGTREFWGLDIEVTPDTLVPRPETEAIVEETLARAAAVQTRIADVCTGSGCIAVALARWLPAARVVAADRSAGALRVACRNAARHGVGNRVFVVRADLLDGLQGPFDIIVANPPYVPAADVLTAQPEVRDFEPHAALDGGADGLDLIRRLVPAAARRLVDGGWLLFEFGVHQDADVRSIVAAEVLLQLTEILHDLAGIPRVAVARRIQI